MLLRGAPVLLPAQGNQRGRHVPQHRRVLQIRRIGKPVVGVLHCRRHLAEELGGCEEDGIGLGYFFPELFDWLREGALEEVDVKQRDVFNGADLDLQHGQG